MPPPTRIQVPYAEKAAIKPPPERVDNILHVYASHDSKVPITNGDWHLIEQHTLRVMLSDQTSPLEDHLVPRSGYDAAHQCGFIASESAASAEWHKRVIRGYGEGNKKLRAWARW